MTDTYRTTPEGAVSFIVHVLDLVVPLVGDCLGPRLDPYLGALRTIQADQDRP